MESAPVFGQEFVLISKVLHHYMSWPGKFFERLGLETFH